MTPTYTLAADPQGRAAVLIRTLPEFGHVLHGRIAWLFSQLPLHLRGQAAAAFIAVPTCQGPMRDFFVWALESLAAPLGFVEPLDFVVFVDVAMYARWPTDTHRERLVYHELCHVVQKTNSYGAPVFDNLGRPRLKLRGHDTEVFDAEVARYGEAVCGLERHVAALKASRKRRGRRRRA